MVKSAFPKYRDRIIYREQCMEAAIREGSVEVNVAYSKVYGARFFVNGWGIASIQSGRVNWNLLEEVAYKNALMASETRNIIEFKDKPVYTGKVKLGGKVGDPEEVLERAETIRAYADETGAFLEASIISSNRAKRIVHEWGEAYEDKTIVEAYVYIKIGNNVGSSATSFTGSIENLSDNVLEKLVEKAYERAMANVKARNLPPTSRGKNTVILLHEASGALIHELVHLLEADQRSFLPIGTRVSTIDLSLIDDPFLLFSPAARYFDDEVYPVSRKILVDKGEVVSLLQTRLTASRHSEDKPGNATGLFHIPKAMHSTLIMKPGDWREEEILEETRSGIIVDSIIMASMRDGVVTIIPEVCWMIRRGEILKPIRVSRIVLPIVKSLMTVDAISRTQDFRHSFEKGHIVVEASPVIRTQGYVE